MNECSTETKEFTSCASLAAIGLKMQELKVFDPIRERVQIAQKTVKHTPTDKLYDAFISILSGAHGLVEINTRLRSDPALQQAFGRHACAEQSVVQETLDACTAENVCQLEEAMDRIYQQHSRGARHNYGQDWQLLDVDMSGLPCGPKAAFASDAAILPNSAIAAGVNWGQCWPVATTRWWLIGSDDGQNTTGKGVATPHGSSGAHPGAG